MADQVPLPQSVESLLQQVASELSKPLPGTPARRELAALGEEASLLLLSNIRNSSLDGFIFYLANQYRSPVSPGTIASPALAPTGAVLPASVEELIDNICNEQSQLPPGPSARRKLALLGEDEALRLLYTIQGSKLTKPFNAFLMYVINNDSPSPASPIRDPDSCALDGDTNSMKDRLSLSPISTAPQPGGLTLLPCTSNRQCLMSSTIISNPNAHVFVPSTNAWKPGGQTSSTLLQTLDELEFRKSFLILSYIGRNKLEEVTSITEIKDLAAPISMAVFENIIWGRFGSRYCQKKDRLKEVDWDSGKRYYYHCYVYSDGSYSLKGPFLNKTATLLQKVLGDENVLIVKFYDLDSSGKKFDPSVSYTGFRKVAEEGIFVGLKRFRFFVFKDGGKQEKRNSTSGAFKSYFVNVDSFSQFYENNASCFDMVSMHAQRCIFMHVHDVPTLSAYMARFSLILSKTITLDVDLDDADVHVEVIDDIPCKDENGFPTYDKDGKLQIHTDGTGFISEELALRCPGNCFKGTSLNDQEFERYLDIVQLGDASTSQLLPDMFQPPLLIQFRMFYKGRAVKGNVLVNKMLQGKRIQIRPSMIKVEPDAGLVNSPAVKSFEIVSTSNRTRKPRLSQLLIALLHYGGVRREFFINILVNEVLAARDVLFNKHAALKVAVAHGDIDDNYTVARMIRAGIPLEEPYIQLQLRIFQREELSSLKKGKLQIDDSFYVMGTADPTGCLKSDEVCIIHETGQIEGAVLVYRHPGMHFGDVHILKATRVKSLEGVVGSSKYGIFFPTNGPRSLADKMCGGDLDGDMYFVSRHPALLTAFEQSAPWTPTPMHSLSQLKSIKSRMSLHQSSWSTSFSSCS